MPYTLSRRLAFEHQQEVAVPSLAPICHNGPDDRKLQTARVPRPYQISADKLDNLEPVRSDRELFSVKSIFVSATNVFRSVDQEKLRSAQTVEYGRYIDYIQHEDASQPEKETKQPCLKIQCRTGCCLNRTFRHIFKNEAPSAINSKHQL